MGVAASPESRHLGSWRGIFSILCTPFESDGALDLDSLGREIAFCVDGGATGLVALVNASEYWTLTDDERMRVAEFTVKSVAGAVPVVIGVTAGSADWAISLARHAQEIGADAVMAMPPSARNVAPADCLRYYDRLTTVLEIPLFVQNHDAPAGTRMTPELVARIVNEMPNADWIKEETLPPGQAITAHFANCGPKLKGVMGGLASRYIFDEYARGVCGSMPACESVDVHAKLWSLLDAGDEAGARSLFQRLLPLLNLEAISQGVYKAVLKERGVIRSDVLRARLVNPLDSHDREELRTVLASLRDDFVHFWPS